MTLAPIWEAKSDLPLAWLKILLIAKTPCLKILSNDLNYTNFISTYAVDSTLSPIQYGIDGAINLQTNRNNAWIAPCPFMML